MTTLYQIRIYIFDTSLCEPRHFRSAMNFVMTKITLAAGKIKNNFKVTIARPFTIDN